MVDERSGGGRGAGTPRLSSAACVARVTERSRRKDPAMTKNPNPPAWRRSPRGLGTGLLAIVLLAAGIAPAAADELAINVLSNRADLISANTALVQVVVPPDVA